MEAGSMQGAASEPWACQLVHHERCGSQLVLDLIAFDPCPFQAVSCPPGTPFTITVTAAGRLGGGIWLGTFETWIRHADMISLSFRTTDDGQAWLSLSDDGHELLLALLG